MSKLNNFFQQFESHCLSKGIPYELVCNTPKHKGVLILKEDKRQSQHLKNQLANEIHNNNVFMQVRNVEQGIILVMSEQIISEDDLSSIAFDTDTKYNEFYQQLDRALSEPTNEAQIKDPIDAYGRASAADQFPDRIAPKKVKKNRKKTIDDKIEEALEGIATPDDIQPQDGIKALFGALKDSGLAQDLRKAGISWQVAEPGKHVVTFNKNKIPILQKSTIELADSKELGEVLNALRSIADGKAPQSGQIQLDLIQQQAKMAREKSKQLDDIATQYTTPDEPQAATGQPALAADIQRDATKTI